jgi:hypothetical protein
MSVLVKQLAYRCIHCRELLHWGLLLNSAGNINYELDVHESMHRDTTMKITNKVHYID